MKIFGYLYQGIFIWVSILLDSIHFSILKILSIDCSWREFKHRKYDHPARGTIEFSDSKSNDAILEVCKSEFEAQEDRRKIIYDKSKSLLTATTILLGFIGIYANYFQSSKWFLAPVIPLLLSAFLLLRLLDIRALQGCVLTQDDVKLEPDAFKIQRAKDFLSSSKYNGSCNDFFADCYRASQICLGISLITITVLLSISAANNSYKQKQEQIVRISPESISAIFSMNDTEVKQLSRRFEIYSVKLDSVEVLLRGANARIAVLSQRDKTLKRQKKLSAK
jgi:hypothetical protein